MAGPKILSIVSHKGGTGKTTTAAFMGAILALRGKRVLLVDLDPQAHLTDFFVNSLAVEKTVWDFLAGQIPSPPVVDTVLGPLKLVPSSSYTYIKGYFGLPPSEVALSHWSVVRLEKFLAGLGDRYDYVILDSSPEPSVGRMVAAVSDYIIVPTRPRTLDVFGAVKFIGALGVHLSTIYGVARRIPRVLGILITMYWHDPERMTRTKRLIEARVVEELASLVQRGYLPREYSEEFPGIYGKVTFSTSIPLASKDVDMVVEEKALVSYAANPNRRLARAYSLLVDEAERRMQHWVPLRLHAAGAGAGEGEERYEYMQMVAIDIVAVAARELGRYAGSWVSVEVYDRAGSLIASRRVKVKPLKTMAGETAGLVEVRVPRGHSGEQVTVVVKPLG